MSPRVSYDVTHAVSGRQKRGSQASTKLQGFYPIKATEISIADLLEVVNGTHQSILSDDVLDVLDVLGEQRNPKGDYANKVKFSLNGTGTPSAQEILSRLAREMTQDPGDSLASLSDEDLRAMLDEIARRQSGETTTGETDNEKSLRLTDSELPSAEEDGTIVSGAVSGALNPTGKAAQKHAKRYYGQIRKMKTDVARIAKSTGYKMPQIRKIKQYLFYDSHLLAGGKFERFAPDFDMAQSWKRLLEGIDIKQHDLTLLKHEIMEMELVAAGMSQDEAHNKTSAIYNYAKEAGEYNDKTKTHKDER